METIDWRDLAPVDGFAIRARIVPDHDSHPERDADCYDASDIDAWKRDEWHYVGVIVTASREGIELGEASLWGLEHGWLPNAVAPGQGRDVDALREDYPVSELVPEALDDARATLAKLCAGTS